VLTEPYLAGDAGRTGYDYTRAARNGLHVSALFDRFIPNLRRYVGYDTDAQYVALAEERIAGAREARAASGDERT